MKVLDKIFRRSPAEKATAGKDSECIHGVLVPKWDSAAEIGKEDSISNYLCEACSTMFTPEEGRNLQESLSERVRLG